MNYDIKLIKKESYTPTIWSGGMATELITYPIGSDYASRNFLWRLGVARIDILESNFSNLPNVSRNFMVTEGKITLEHENKYSKTLNPFDQDIFMGDWKTKTYGKASVFNLMTKENYHGELIHLHINPLKETKFIVKPSCNTPIESICFYALNGGFKSKINNKIFMIENADLLCLNYTVNSNNIPQLTFSNTSEEITDIIVSIIYHS
ncbi:HutD family protein [Clostridium uliginosum]|uniref:HutD protein n=1 Tax=Clostridium uliginosum TaxID=119641 RepID=A0A1I1J1W5_9CLOT|nr:HutD family protein [Clostridium uliginosum]SFC42091.1 HutD protein [Clostridium uliginosum]